MLGIIDWEISTLGDPLAGLVDGGDLFLQSALGDPEAIWGSIPSAARAEIIARLSVAQLRLPLRLTEPRFGAQEDRAQND